MPACYYQGWEKGRGRRLLAAGLVYDTHVGLIFGRYTHRHFNCAPTQNKYKIAFTTLQ